MTDTFTCAHCGGTFPKGWSDEEAEAEGQANFGKETLDRDGRALICDVCWLEFKGWYKATYGGDLIG